MIVPDSNLLLYAYNSSAPFHGPARTWWESALSGSEPVGLTHPVIFAFLRISTSTRAVPVPFTLAEAVGHIASWLERKVCRVLQEGPGHVEKVCALLASVGSSGGNLVTDAQIAALALAHRGTVYTVDRDFARFADLNCCFPLDE